jgi:hypothetical protein
MRRFVIAAVATSVALTLVIPTAVNAGTDAPTDPVRDRPADAVTDIVRDIERLRLECGVRADHTGQVVRCEWSEPTARAAHSVRLFRLDPATDPHRQVVFRTKNLGETGFTDTKVRSGHKYAYAVQSLNENGRVVGQSETVWVRVVGDPVIEALRLNCKLGDAGEAIGCEWSRPTSRDAYVVSLWRSVDGGARQLVEQFRPTGPNTYRDAVPAGARHITYAVVATNESDRVVGQSRPETVRIPQIDAVPTDVVRITDVVSDSDVEQPTDAVIASIRQPGGRRAHGFVGFSGVFPI